jgi:capsular polysaccharide biosynthesis protein
MSGVFEDVHVNHEALIFRGGRIYPESFVAGSAHATHYHRLSRYTWFLLKNYWLRRGEVSIRSGLWAIDNYSPENYYHWMIDVLPRLLQAEEDHPGERVLLLPRYYHASPYIGFSLRAFPHIERIRWIAARSKTRVERLAYVARQSDDALPDRVVEVARRMTELAGAAGTARRIYFTRDDAKRRRASNEADVARVLRQHDIEVHRIDPSRPWEQMRAGLGANLVVGVHGAALTNAILMRPGGRLLELRHSHERYFADHYRPLAAMVGIEYQRQYCELAHPAEGLAINDADLVVDLDLLRENLRRAGC